MSVSKEAACSIFVDSRKCTGCGDCIEVCDEDAISIHDTRFTDREACTCCGDCAEVCEQDALKIVPKTTEPSTL